MSVELYSQPFFKGIILKLDIGKYFEHNLKGLTIGSLIINDNVQLVINYSENKKLTLCSPQIVNKMDTIDNIKSITIKHSICDPYTDKNSILNRYSIGKNFSIQFNEDLKEINPEENLKNGFVDFWYNNQTNKQSQYFKTTGGHVVPHHYSTTDDYNTARVDLYNYSLYNKWYDNKLHAKHGQYAVYNHLEQKFPTINTNNIANCKFDTGRNSKTFRRNYVELNCKPNGLAGQRMGNNLNMTSKCHKDVDEATYMYERQNGNIVKTGISLNRTNPSRNDRTTTVQNNMNDGIPSATIIPPNTGDVVEGFDDLTCGDDYKLNSKYKQYYMSPVENNPNRDETILTIYNGTNFTDAYLELDEGFYIVDRFNVFNNIKSLKIKEGTEVTLFNDRFGKFPITYFKNGKFHNKLVGPMEESDLENKLSDAIVAICVNRTNKGIIEGFGNIITNNNLILIVAAIALLCIYYNK